MKRKETVMKREKAFGYLIHSLKSVFYFLFYFQRLVNFIYFILKENERLFPEHFSIKA